MPRLLSALVLAPVALGAVYLGSPFLDILVVAAALVMAWEWAHLCGNRTFGVRGLVLGGVLLAALMAISLGRPRMALGILAMGLVAVYLFAMREPKDGRHSWLAAGVPYIGLPCVALLWMAADPADGYRAVFWLFAVVWGVDIGGYVFGSTIGGAKLAPAISPNKTWAGLIGGTAVAGAAGAVTAVLLGKDGIVPLSALSAGLGVVAQIGDLGESWVKRHFGVKDAGNLIPGHGGVLDRVDGLLVVLLVVALIRMVSGQGVLTWL